MKKQIKLSLFALTCVFLLSSCSTSFRIKSADSLDINKGQVQQVSKLADYEVKTEKVSGKYSGIYKAKKPVYYMNLAKDLAVGDAILKAKCDFLIHPLYDIKVSGESIEVTVEGYPANYIKFETVEYTTTYSEEPQTPDNSSNTQNFINRFIK